MKKTKTIFAFILILSIILQPSGIRAAYVDLDGNIHLRRGCYSHIVMMGDRVPHGDSSSWIKSGNYHYEFLDRSKSYITIRKIEPEALKDGKLVIPDELDGHIVLGTSVWDEDYSQWDEEQCCVLEEPEKLEELILPQSVEFLGFASFYKCFGLKKISFPPLNYLAYIGPYALEGCINLKEVKFPPGVYVTKEALGRRYGPVDMIFDCHLKKITLYTDCLVYFNKWFSKEDKAELYIRKHNYEFYVLTVPGDLNKLYIDKELSLFQLKMAYDEDWDDSDPPMLNRTINKLIMNGKETVLWLPKEINEVFPAGGLKSLYTVKGAVCIREAKKYRIPIYWKTSGKAKEVKAKKKDGTYQASWKKIKTNICKYWYNLSKGQWTTKKTPEKTTYKVYGKSKKSDTYRLIKTTKKKNIQSEYKYIKAVAVKEW